MRKVDLSTMKIESDKKTVLLEKQSLKNSIRHLLLNLFEESIFIELPSLPSSLFYIRDGSIICELELLEDVVYFNYQLIEDSLPQSQYPEKNIRIMVNTLIREFLQNMKLTVVSSDIVKRQWENVWDKHINFSFDV